MKRVKQIKITLDKPRTLRMDFNAMAAFEDSTGINLMVDRKPCPACKGIGRLGTSECENCRGAGEVSVLDVLSAKQIRGLLWAMMLHEDPELKETYVGSMIHSGNLEEVNAAILSAMSAAAPEPDGEPAGEGNDGKNADLPTG